MADQTPKLRPMIADLEAIPPIDCPCGQARRAFLVPGNTAASIHLVDIKNDPEVHYHDKHTEIYYILEGEGFIELDGERSPVKPGTAVLIPPRVASPYVGQDPSAEPAHSAFRPRGRAIRLISIVLREIETAAVYEPENQSLPGWAKARLPASTR